MDWDDLRVFLHVARCRSMTEASLALGLSVPTIARRLEALEQATGLRLVKRTPRGLLLTDQGARFADRAANLRREAADLERFLIELRADQTPALVRVSATEPVISEILAPRLATLLAMKGSPRIELRVENEIAAIALTDVDIAVRLVRPEADALMARRLATLDFGLFGSAAYLTALGPIGPDRFGRAAILTYDDRYGPIPERRWIDGAGLSDRVVARTSSTRGLIAAVASGAGLAILPRILAIPAGLQEIQMDAATEFPRREVWLVWHRTMTRHGPTRMALDWIAEAFGDAARSAGS